MEWYRELYVSEELRKEIPKIKRKLNHRKLQRNLFLVTYASNPANLLDIIGSEQLMQRILYENCPMIVAVASSKTEALQIVQQIAEETYAKQGNVDVRRYLSDRQEERQG